MKQDRDVNYFRLLRPRFESGQLRRYHFQAMPGIGSQNYGSKPSIASQDEPVATNHLDGLQWGKSGLEMDEERKQQVLALFLIVAIGFVDPKRFFG